MRQEDLVEQIDKLFEENRGAEAEKLMEQALQEAYEAQDLAAAVPILNELIGYCRETSQVERSYTYAEKVQEILHQLGMEGTLPHATTLLNIANAYRAGGRLEDSLHFYEKVSKIYSEILPKDDMLWASYYNNLSLLYQELSRFDLAKTSLLKALEIVIQKKDTIFEQAVTYTNLAASCLQLGQGEEAEKYFTGAILLFEKHGIRDTHYCAALASLATYLYQKKEYAKAEEVFQKAMEGIEANLGKNEFYHRMAENVQICRRMQQKPVQETEAFVSGLTLCRAYYEAYCKPMLEAQFAQYVDRIAVGLVGEGSDCFGYDDTYSKDHDWGPRLLLWVDEETYQEIGEALEAAYEKLPKEYQGFVYQESPQAQNRYGVQKIEDFYRALLGAENCPKEGQAWTAEAICWEKIEDSRLAAATNGEVFVDNDGAFGKIRTLLKEEYPARLRYLKMAEAAARFAQNGQYNYPRTLKRGDKATAQLMLAEAMKEALKLLYYREGLYPPHEKWLLRGLQGKAELAEVLGLVEGLLTEQAANQSDKLEALGEQLAYLLYRADAISDVNGFLQEHVNELLFKAALAEKTVEELAEQIAKTEFAAFDKVKNQGGRADCQDDWFTFSIMRKSQYLTWNQGMLLQYLYDFTREYNKGHNLIEEKYGRMMESTAPEEYERMKEHFPKLSPEKKQIIEEIVRLQVKYMEEFAAAYPKLAGNARSIHTYEDNLYNTSYETYLRGEISTYSDKMLELYGRYIVEFVQAGKNTARETMLHSVLMYGYEGLDEAEAVL